MLYQISKTMEVYQLIRKGEMHKDFCEDFLLVSEPVEQYSFYGVFDGCSSGQDSHLASGLLAKIVRAEVQFLVDEPITSLNKLLSDTILNTMSTLRNIRNDLLLDTNELLATMILLVVDNHSRTAEILVFGDGFVSVNGKPELIDQDNSPDYPAYHLDELDAIDDFESWLKLHSKHYEISEIRDISIATDGIASFQQSEAVAVEAGVPVPVDFLSDNTFLLHNKSMLSRKCNILRSKYHLVNQDDIAMIRIIA